MRYSVFFAVLLFPFLLFAQPSDYWQQHVSYTISGTLIDSIHSFDGKLSVVYTNNSPDTLREVYFHLYANAFQPGSMMHVRAKAMNDLGLVNRFEHYKRSDWGEYKIPDVDVGGASVRPLIAGTIMKVDLPKPLAPKSSVKLSMSFFEQIPLQTRRSGWMNGDGIKYSMCQWYPKICEYDREGWHHQEYVSREFYGVWGEFDVTVNVPGYFCVGATGQCQNPTEVGWGYDQIAAGVKKGIVHPDSAKKAGMISWHFKASNVHDFAWVAHEYIHEWDTWSDTVTVHCLYKASEEKYWSEAMKNTFAMLDHHSKKVGWYQYRNFTNTHAGDGGMEYPQLIMDGSPNAGLIMHEGGHQWFYGMLGNNETRYAFLDEGFTEFIEMTGMNAYYGIHNERSPYRDTSWLSSLFIPEYDSRRNYYSPYLSLATAGYEEPLTIPHDWFREGVNAGQVYFKTLAGLAQLEYVLGDSMFWAGMKEYFRRWHFKHPNLNDFKHAMQDVSGADLDWYFDQWFGSTRTIDYSAGSVSNEGQQAGGVYLTKITACNKNVGVMPLDLTLHYDDGTTGIATIPLSVNQGIAYRKPEQGRIFFTPWDWVSPTYEGTAVTPKKVDWYEIDTSYRLMDLDRRYNTSRMMPPTQWSFLKQYNNYPPLGERYDVIRPIIWYDEVSRLNLGLGFQFGMVRQTSGDFKLITKLAPQRMNDGIGLVDPKWYDYIDGELKFEHYMPILGRLTSLGVDIRKLNDVVGVNLSLEHTIRPEYLYLGATHKIGFDIDYEERGALDDQENIVYPVYPEHWDSGIERSLGMHYNYISASRNTKAYFSARIGNLVSVEKYFDSTGLHHSTETEGFSQFLLSGSHFIPISSEFGLHLRATVARTNGSLNDQYYYNLSGATFSQSLRNDFFRSIASISRHFSEQAHFILDGGAGVRGYGNDRFDPTYQHTLQGTDLISGNLDIRLPNPISGWGSFTRSFDFGLFADAGWVGNFQHGSLSTATSIGDIAKQLMTDAGVSVSVSIVSWLPWQLQGVAEEYGSIPQISFYFPIYENHPIDGKSTIDFRYVISLGTSFTL